MRKSKLWISEGSVNGKNGLDEKEKERELLQKISILAGRINRKKREGQILPVVHRVPIVRNRQSLKSPRFRNRILSSTGLPSFNENRLNASLCPFLVTEFSLDVSNTNKTNVQAPLGDIYFKRGKNKIVRNSSVLRKKAPSTLSSSTANSPGSSSRRNTFISSKNGKALFRNRIGMKRVIASQHQEEFQDHPTEE